MYNYTKLNVDMHVISYTMVVEIFPTYFPQDRILGFILDKL